MKKRRITLVSLLALCMVLILALMPMSVIAVESAENELVGTKLTTSHAGKTLSGDYYVEPGKTLTISASTGKSGLIVESGKTLTIHIPSDSILYVYGGAATGTTGAGAGIEVVSGATLKITGSGKLYAYGGKAANGSKGANGENANWVDDGKSYIPDGGYGGAGGGGAGAGIGTKGGNGGSGAGWTRGFYGGLSKETEKFVDINYSGPNGGNGGSGSSAVSCGAIYISADITYTATGGAAGTSGGSGGSKGSSDYESDNHWMRGMAGGAGGGGGGAGKAGANVGTGGGGGGGGGAGGGVGYVWSYRFLGGGGGGGGAGAVGGGGGAWAQDGEVPDCKKFQYFGGVERYSSSGASGSTSSGGSGGQGAKVKITDWDGDVWQYPYGGYGGSGGSAGSNCKTATVQKLYDVSLSLEGEIIGTYCASATEFLPASIEIPSKTGYIFDGFYVGDVAYYDVNGVRTTAEITEDTVISAKFTAIKYDVDIDPSEGSTGGGVDVSNGINYGDAITLTTPTREGYLFRGWKISATNGSINKDAYYTYAYATPMLMKLRAADHITADFVHLNGSAITAGFEKIGERITLYNLSADDNAQLKIEEMWVKDSFNVTFKDFDGSVIDTQNGKYGTDLIAPALPDNQNEYYTYTFKYWKCNIDNRYYSSSELPFLGYFLGNEDTLGNKVFDGVTFTAVYDITEYKKELHFVGSLGNTNLNSDGKLVLNNNDTNVDVITNFKITKNDGVSSLLLIPQYDASAFSIKAISVNGELVYGTGASSTTVLNGFKVSVTGNEVASTPLKVLLDNLEADASTSNDIFIQIIYVMKTAIGGEYEFGFVTNTPTDTDSITHGDRSEAYANYHPDSSSDKDAWRFNELKITVDSTAIKVIIRADGKITIDNNQSFVYNSQQISATDETVSDVLEKILKYNYNGFFRSGSAPLTITWYDADGNILSEAPKDAGTYKIGISAAETSYYTAVTEVFATFTITKYEIYVSAGNQSFEYNGSNIVINSSASNGGLFIKDELGNLIPVDDFVNSEITLNRVELINSYINAGSYAETIQGVISGALDNYTVIYKNGTLTITKAENDWAILPDDKTVEYSGNSVAIDNVSANFGYVKVEYLIGYEKDAEGNYVLDANKERIPIWSETAPTNAGAYPVRVTVADTDNFSGLEYEVMLVITKKKVTAEDFNFEAIDKVYNGESQYWSLDPNDDGKTSDAEVKILVSDSNALMLQYVKFAGMLNSDDCINVGEYTIKAILQISNPNYTFIKDGEEIDSWTYDVVVEIVKRKIIINANDQSAEYTGNEPTVNQGSGYFTITLEDGTTAPIYVIRDFFGGDLYVAASDIYSDNEVYYVLVDKVYTRVSVTKEEFDNNLRAENPIQYYVSATFAPVESLTLSKALGVNAGIYDLIATLGVNSNYEIISCNGVFEILKRGILLPTLPNSIYNNEVQIPTLPEGAYGIYEIVTDGHINADTYDVTVHLIDPNYQWIITSEEDNEEYTVTDQIIAWTIDPKIVYVVLPDAPDSYVYADMKSVDKWLEDYADAYTWAPGYVPFDGDDIYVVWGFAEDHHLTAGDHNAYVLDVHGSDQMNYIVRSSGGKVTINKKVLTEAELYEYIKANVKYYTGSKLELTKDDFAVLMQNMTLDQVIRVNRVVSIGDDVVNANGTYDAYESEFNYYGATRYNVTVALELLDTQNYEFADGADEMDVEAFIAKATNKWTDGPSVDASDITDVKYSANAQFKDSIKVLFYKDNEGTWVLMGEDDSFAANERYQAKFIVDDTDNYSGLETVIIFSGSNITIIKPVVRLDTASGDIVNAGGKITFVYDGKTHTLVIPDADGKYAIAIDPNGYKNANVYTVTVTLTNGNYVWDDGTNAQLIYTIEILKKDLTIKADDKTVMYGAAIPEYSVVTEGLVAGETLAELLGDKTIADYISCEYTKETAAGTYENYIKILTEIKSVLVNYEVTLVNGKMVVEKFVFDFGNIQGGVGNIIKPLPDLLLSDVTFVYDGFAKDFIVQLPDGTENILNYSISYSLGETAIYGAPTNAGVYTVTVTLSLKDGVEDNYWVPQPEKVMMVIEKASITITVNDQNYDYDGTDHSSEINSSAMHMITVNNGQTLADTVTLTLVSGEYINAGLYTDVIVASYNYDLTNYVVTVNNGDVTVKKVDNSWTSNLNASQNIVFDKSPVAENYDFASDSRFGDQYVEYTFYEKIGENWFELVGAPTQAGEYAVEARVPGTNNYNELVSERVPFTIRKAIITIDGLTFNNGTFTYNGEEHYIYVTGETLSVFNVDYTGNGKVNAGRYSVTATFVLVDERNYMFDGSNTMTADLIIEAVKVTIGAIDNESVFGNQINGLDYTIVFNGAENYDSFYATDFGSVILNTTATSVSNVGAYKITISYTDNPNYDVTIVEGTYRITKFTNNTIDLTASDVRYLMDLVYSATALRGQNTITFTFAESINGPFNITPKNVGTYYIKATVAGTINYDGAEAIVEFEITKATLSAITDITYNADTATWSAVGTTTDGKEIDCDVTYLIDGKNITVTTFTANKTGVFTVVAEPVDKDNYTNSAEITLATVYSVDFADKVENHNRQLTLADLTDAAYATQYRFAGQSVTRPDAIPTIVGYTFRTWQLNNVDYGFSEGVYGNITIYAAWTINTYTVSFFNEKAENSGSIQNGVFVPGRIYAELITSITVEYGDPIPEFTGTPTRPSDVVYQYTFAYWSEELGGSEFTGTIVTDNLSLYAVYNRKTGLVTIVYMLSVDGAPYQQYGEALVTEGYALELLESNAWFAADGWYVDPERTTRIDGVPVVNITLYGAYVFDIGAGDVNGDKLVNTGDIFDYRCWVVGGYNIVKVEPGTEWDVINSDNYSKDNIYYLVRVSDANQDDSGDIRDITTIRMALTGGYGYIVETNNNVTGDAVGLVLSKIPGVTDADTLQDVLNENTGDAYIKLTSDVTLTKALILDSGRNVTIHLNGYTLTLPSVNNYGVVVKNGTLTIEGQGNVIIPGYYGFGTPSNTTTGHIVINGGNFVGESTDYMFGCYNGSITINGGSFVSNYCVLNNFPDDGNGNSMMGVATVNGGDFTVIGTDDEYPSCIFLGDVDVEGEATYRVHTEDNLAMAMKNGGKVILLDDIVLENSLTVPKDKTVVLELNGHDIDYISNVVGTSQLINNYGDLTILGEGNINYHANNPDTNSIPSYASNAITNKGRLTIGEGSTVQNTSSGGASYAIDNDGYFHLNGGTVIARGTAVRVCIFNSSAAEVIVDSGLIEGNEGLRIQLAGNASSVAPDVKLTVNGGTLRSTDDNGFAMTAYSFGNSYSNVVITINDGEFYGWATVGTGNSDPANVTVSGGYFDHYGVYDYSIEDYYSPYNVE